MSLVRIAESAPVRALQSLGAAVQSPFLSGPLLAALLCAPDPVRQQVLRHAPAGLDVDAARKVLQALLGLGLLKSINRGLSSMAANGWRATAAPGWDWPSEVAVVTGGCSGIGHCIVRRLAARRVRVAVLDVQDLPADLAADPLVRLYTCDITAPDAVAAAAAAIRNDLGHPSILVNNAGITRPLAILDMPHDFLRRIFGVNCLSHWTLAQQFLPHMVAANKGHVMTVASMASFIPLPKGADYAATKAAALSFHESLAVELRHVHGADRVLASIAHPNFVRTPLVRDFGHHLERGGIRMLAPDDVAALVADQIFSRRAAQLIIPEHQAVLSGVRAWPTWLKVLLLDQLAANTADIGTTLAAGSSA
ncbi:short-chain dehydrogenase/reductase 2 [Metarhizium album ARSEF 1941]|uniref:Hydroxynaphthalene reductase-like protein Arp2 n=1 Tax=Metarhizium album (strain ARSEF 1941) TaxID=1081103 RepID=A0A0B2WTW9_METAS|nr:short-chain dehydrogenase/reductase 2 [Metarhizium album ARSEF 1941]KHN97099.1 short-chain dehydrogenase/reductase 2 [Metarhizium album ARSEF 1941]